MKKTTFLLIFLLLMGVSLQAQVDTAWTKTYGGSQGDLGYYGEPTSDGGYIVVGETSSFGAGGSDVYLIRTDALGDSLWTKTYGDNFDERGNCVIQTENNGFVITGYVEYGYDSARVCLIRTDSLGNLLWEKTYDIIPPPFHFDYAYFVQGTSDNGYIITGRAYNSAGPEYQYSDAFLLKTDSLGNVLWKNTYGTEWGETGYCVRETYDGGYIVTGAYTTDYLGTWGRIYLFKTDKDGNLLWEQAFGQDPYEDHGYCVQLIQNKGYIITGQTGTYNDWQGDVYLMKTDSLGNQKWTPTYFGGSDWDRGKYLEQTPEGGSIIVGRTMSFGDPNGDIYLLKTDSLGTLLWQQTFGGTGIEFGSSIQRTSDGGYFITATTSSFGAGSWDAYLIKTNPDVAVKEKVNTPLKDSKLLISTPTFFTNEIRVNFSYPYLNPLQITLYNTSGRQVLTEFFPSSSTSLHLRSERIGRLPSGAYFLKISTDKKILSQNKILKLSKRE
jgi:hypothetical protein